LIFFRAFLYQDKKGQRGFHELIFLSSEAFDTEPGANWNYDFCTFLYDFIPNTEKSKNILAPQANPLNGSPSLVRKSS